VDDQAYSKAGRSTGFTTGLYSGLKKAHIHKEFNPHSREWEKRATWECVLLKHQSPPLAEPGDSGSLVYDPLAGEVVGLLFAESKADGHFLFTPILDVFEDIKRVTGAIDVQIVEDSNH
jgi:hypothetical protein